MAEQTIEQVYRSLTQRLAEPLGEREAKAAARAILEDVRGITPNDLIINPNRTVESMTMRTIDAIADRIIRGEPVQYAVGSARFYGMDFIVSPAVLIPRPETEGLVDMIVHENAGHNDLRILDVGTGSGCIAVALSRNLPFSKVDALDISSAALAVARENAQRLNAKVKFIEADILALPAPDQPLYDIIVSNPPYIARREEADMDPRVTAHEPESALFVPDDDPLLFYRAIAVYGRSALPQGGRLYFEINPLFTDSLRDMLEKEGYSDIDITRDYLGHYRFATASRQ